MRDFIQRHGSSVMGVLNGYDRIGFRGTLRWLCCVSGLGRYLSVTGVHLTDFKDYTQSISTQLRASIEAVVQGSDRPVKYVVKPSISKEAYAREIAERDGIREGLIAVLYAVEPCQSFRLANEL